VKKLFIIGFALSTIAFASSSSGGETDIVPRTVNFLIFAGIIYYLLADKAKVFFSGRRDNIAKELNKVQDLIKESKKAKDEAELKVKESSKKAEDIIETAKKEAEALIVKIDKIADNDIKNLIKQNQENIELERRKVKQVVVDEVLKEIFRDGGLKIDEKEFVNIIMKKVA
jgi:F-type H+-transporting ATPase subunit b